MMILLSLLLIWLLLATLSLRILQGLSQRNREITLLRFPAPRKPTRSSRRRSA